MKTETSDRPLIISSFSKILGLTLTIIILSISPVFAEQQITFQKILDVEKNTLQDTLSNVRNYEKIFPDVIRSVDILKKSEDKTLTEFSLGFGMIPLQVMVEQNVVSENTNELNVISGDLKGTEVTTTLTKTWGFDGMPEKATIVQIDMSLKVSGFLALLGIIDENLIYYALEDSLFRLQEFSSGNLNEEKIQQKSIQKKRR